MCLNRLHCDDLLDAATKIEHLQAALAALLVEFVAGRKEGNIDSFAAEARRVVKLAQDALEQEATKP